MTVQTYNLKASNGKHIRKATMVVLADGRKFRFMERMGRRQVITQLENMLAMSIHHNSADQPLINEALEAVINDSDFLKVSA